MVRRAYGWGCILMGMSKVSIPSGGCEMRGIIFGLCGRRERIRISHHAAVLSCSFISRNIYIHTLPFRAANIVAQRRVE